MHVPYTVQFVLAILMLGQEEARRSYKERSKQCCILDPTISSSLSCLSNREPSVKTGDSRTTTLDVSILYRNPFKTKETMSHPSHSHTLPQEPTSSPQGSSRSTETDSLHDSDSLPLLIQYQTGTHHSPTAGHAFICVSPFPPISLQLLTKTAIQALRETHNPNNSQVFPGTANVERLIVHWGVPAQRPDALAFPSTTQLSEENLEVVLRYMRHRRGYDFVEIRFEERAANPPLMTFPLRFPLKSVKKKEQSDSTKGAGRGFKPPPKLDYSA